MGWGKIRIGGNFFFSDPVQYNLHLNLKSLIAWNVYYALLLGARFNIRMISSVCNKILSLGECVALFLYLLFILFEIESIQLLQTCKLNMH